MSRSSRRLAVLVAVVAVLGAGCASRDVDGSDAANVLKDAGAPKAVQTCVGDRIDDELDQGQKNEVGEADNLADLPNELEQTVQTILDECVESDGAATSSETTETTEADGGTTTTSAPG
jgi:hypothetical protein